MTVAPNRADLAELASLATPPCSRIVFGVVGGVMRCKSGSMMPPRLPIFSIVEPTKPDDSAYK